VDDVVSWWFELTNTGFVDEPSLTVEKAIFDFYESIKQTLYSIGVLQDTITMIYGLDLSVGQKLKMIFDLIEGIVDPDARDYDPDPIDYDPDPIDY